MAAVAAGACCGGCCRPCRGVPSGGSLPGSALDVDRACAAAGTAALRDRERAPSDFGSSELCKGHEGGVWGVQFCVSRPGVCRSGLRNPPDIHLVQWRHAARCTALSAGGQLLVPQRIRRLSWRGPRSRNQAVHSRTPNWAPTRQSMRRGQDVLRLSFNPEIRNFDVS